MTFGKFSVLFSLIFMAAGALAAETRGTVVLFGGGSKSSVPEFASMTVDVISVCYDSPREASEANGDAASKIVAQLQTFLDGARDKLNATGAVSFKHTETTEVGDNPRIICENKWRSENKITIETPNISAVSLLQDQVLLVLGGENSRPGDDGKANTFLALSRPTFGLYKETLKRLYDEAQVAALDDARSQMAALRNTCQFSHAKIVRINPPEYQIYAKAAGIRVETGSSGPAIPDEMEVSARLYVEWAFTPGQGCTIR